VAVRGRELTAPVVTITDPLHPAPLRDVAAAPPRGAAWLRPLERALVTVLVLLLVAATTSAGRLRADQRQQQRLTGLALGASLVSGQLAMWSGPQLAVDLVLRGDDHTDITLSDLAADGGWHVQGGTPDLLARGASTALTLTHDVDCAGAVAAPRHLTFTAAVEGVGTRTVRLRVADDVAEVVPSSAPICGDLEAELALSLSTSSVVRERARTVATLQLVNVGLADLRVLEVVYPGIAFRARAGLPLVLPGRGPGPLGTVALVEHPVVFDVRVVDCGVARAALDSATQEQPDRVLVLVEGRGRTGSADLDVQGVEAFLEQDWLARCG
jgi:hypothetical protein